MGSRSSRFARLQGIQCAIAGKNVYMRFSCSTGDAMGMNMVSKGVQNALDYLQSDFPDMDIIGISGKSLLLYLHRFSWCLFFLVYPFEILVSVPGCFDLKRVLLSLQFCYALPLLSFCLTSPQYWTSFSVVSDFNVIKLYKAYLSTSHG